MLYDYYPLTISLALAIPINNIVNIAEPRLNQTQSLNLLLLSVMNAGIICKILNKQSIRSQ